MQDAADGQYSPAETWMKGAGAAHLAAPQATIHGCHDMIPLAGQDLEMEMDTT